MNDLHFIASNIFLRWEGLLHAHNQAGLPIDDDTIDLAVAAKVDTSFQGSYRNIIQRATNMSFEVKKYKGKDNAELSKTGLEELIYKAREKKHRDHNNIDKSATHSMHNKEVVNGSEEDR